MLDKSLEKMSIKELEYLLERTKKNELLWRYIPMLKRELENRKKRLLNENKN